MVRKRITDELASHGVTINRRTITRHLNRLGLGQRRLLDPNGENNRKPGKIVAHWPGHMAHLDVKKVGRIPDGGGWRIHSRDSKEAKAVDRAKSAGAKRGYVYLHSIVDGFSRLAYTEPLPDEKGSTAAAFLVRAKAWFAAHGITHIHRVVTDNGACYRSGLVRVRVAVLRRLGWHRRRLCGQVRRPPSAVRLRAANRGRHFSTCPAGSIASGG